MSKPGHPWYRISIYWNIYLPQKIKFVSIIKAVESQPIVSAYSVTGY